MKARLLLITAAVLVAGFVAATPASAHHSFGAEYDKNKPINVTGTVTKFEWTNPHARFYVDVKDDKGAVTNWNFELASPNVLKNQGWTRNSLKEGDTVTVVGSAAKDGAKMGNASTVTLPNGQRVGARSTTDPQ